MNSTTDWSRVYRPYRGTESSAIMAVQRRMQAELARLGVTEEELVADFKRWRKARRAK